MSLIDEDTKKKLEELASLMPPGEYESAIMGEGCDRVSACIACHAMSRNALLKNWYIGRMRQLLRENANLVSYTGGIGYAKCIGRPDLVKEFREELCNQYPVVGSFYYAFLSLTLEVFNPYK